MKTYCVYKHTAPHGKVYIGITCQLPCQRWARGKGYRNNWHFYNAIQKYGWDNFQHEILYTGLTQEEAAQKEYELIAQYDATNEERGYNRDYGGTVRRPMSAETRQKISAAHKGKATTKGPAHPQWGKKGPLSQNYGRKHTPEERALMSANNTRKIPVVCIEDGKVYSSAVEAAKDKGTYGGSINACCNKRPHYNTAGGYHWRYLDEQRDL